MLFKKAYFHNWDNGLGALVKIVKDKDCDKATALTIFWVGSPDYFYNDPGPENLEDYNKANYDLLKLIEGKVLNNDYESVIQFQVDKDRIPKKLGNIPKELTVPIKDGINEDDILFPKYNPFGDEIVELCRNCKSVDEMYALADKGADFFLKISDYTHAIEVATGNKQLEAIKYFINEGFDLNKKFNKDPLIFEVVISQDLEVIKLLLENGVKIKRKGEFGRTVLHTIAGRKQWEVEFTPKMIDIIEYLVEKGASLEATDTDKKTPLDLAEMWENQSYINYIKSVS